jgi:NAD(P)-dependent dehydrogenase (short-subunit alcohol dehydrogenase family)
MPRSSWITGLSSEGTSTSALPLEDKVAIVTGAATGIGKGIAARLAADGAAAVVNHLQPQTVASTAAFASLVYALVLHGRRGGVSGH